MSAITQQFRPGQGAKMQTTTKVTCDSPGCRMSGRGLGNSETVRRELDTQGWTCDDEARVDLCPVHKP